MTTDQDSKTGVLNYGGAGPDHPIDEALLNFPGAAMQPLSLCCTPIELLSNDGLDQVVARGTGFFWKYAGLPYLITNWHIASGKNIFTGGNVSKQGYIPGKIRFHGLSIDQRGEALKFHRQKWVLTIDEQAQALLAQPPKVLGREADIWGIQIPPHCVLHKDRTRTGFVGAEDVSSFVNDHVGARIITRAGDDCFVLGYPLANYEGLMPPVWKRGSIASDTNIGVDNRPIFLVDAATAPSMSGAPIFRRVVTAVAFDHGKQALVEHTSFAFVGVYAGRLQSAELEKTNIGYGWYATLINGVLDYYGYGKGSLQLAKDMPSGDHANGVRQAD
jgi:hypothetical protein